MNTGYGNINSKQPNGKNGWFFGLLDDGTDLPYPWKYKSMQMKWAELKSNKNSEGIKDGDEKTTISILVKGGPHEIILYKDEQNPETYTLNNIGDFVYWGPNIRHSWKAIDANTTITFRWKE